MTRLPSRSPQRWTFDELTRDASASASTFRTERLASSDAWAIHYRNAMAKFELLFEKLDDLHPQSITDAKLAAVNALGLGEALRYLAGPPISDDDLRVIADVDSVSVGFLKSNPQALRERFKVIERIIDPFRFPWVAAQAAPTQQQRECALVASSVLLAAQRMATARRVDVKDAQEARVKHHLRDMGFVEVPATSINTLVRGPQTMQFCAECQLGERKAAWRCSGRMVWTSSATSSIPRADAHCFR